jgi:hypothetical protein
VKDLESSESTQVCSECFSGKGRSCQRLTFLWSCALVPAFALWPANTSILETPFFRVMFDLNRGGKPGGTLPVSQPSLALSRRGVLVTAFSDDPDRNPSTLLWVWEQAGKSGDLIVSLPKGMKATRATPVNLSGKVTGKPLAISGGKSRFPLSAFAPASFVLDAQQATLAESG